MNYKRLFVPNSLLFITVVTKNRRPILIDNISYLRTAFHVVKAKYSFDIVAIVVNQDHFHAIICPKDINLYPRIIANIKRMFTKLSKLKHTLNTRRESPVWQRRYWEHTIRDEKDLYRHIDYIHYNSVKHYGITPGKWPFSSFHKFVKEGYYPLNWCNDGDKYKIENMDEE